VERLLGPDLELLIRTYVLDEEGRLLLDEVYLGIDQDDASQRNATLFGRTPATYLRHGCRTRRRETQSFP
jgi:hypothetical protein